MSSRNVFWVALLALLALVASVGTAAPSALAQVDPPDKPVEGEPPPEPEPDPEPTAEQDDPVAIDLGPASMWRVYVNGDSDIDVLTSGGYDLLEAAGDGYLLVIGEDAVAEELRTKGLRVELDRELETHSHGTALAAPGVARAAAGPTFYGGYRSVVEHYAHLNDVASIYPNLATVVDYGDSWNAVNGQPDPNDLLAICLTNKQAGDCALNPNSAKPRAVYMAAIHARELQTSEIAWRLIDDLTQNYGTDADITHLMDTTEIWVIPVANPDGREIVESGENNPYLQRKNANDNLGNCALPPTSGNQHGIDLNRNASSPYWGGTGTSTNPCAATYPGTSPASEPEMQALETLFGQLFLDQKGALGAPALTTTEGTFITIHSFSDLVLLPNGPGGSGLSPNDAELRALAFRMSHFNGYVAGTGPEILYAVTGATDDWLYYELGIPGFTYEISPVNGVCSGFTPAYSCIDSLLWPLNREALLYSARVASAPYVTSRGPSATTITAPTTLEVGEVLNVSAVLDDNTLGTASGSVGRPTPLSITGAQYFIDASDLQSGTPVDMTAADGSFNQTTETASASIPTAGLAPGQHTLFIRGQNANGYWGPVQPVFFNLTPGVDDPPVADDQSVSVALNGSVAITLTGADPEGATLSYSISSGPSNGTLSGTAPNVTYSPDGGYIGSDSFTFTVNDGSLTSPTATASISVTDPQNGPVFVDDFESDLGWQTNPLGTDPATTGQWERANPQPTNSNGPKQLDTTTSGSNALVTAAAAGSSVGTNDIDNGVTSTWSPIISLPPGTSLGLTFDYYMAHTSNSSSADFLRVSVLGNTTQVVLEELGAAENDDGAWQQATIDLTAFAGQDIRLLIEAADAAGGSIVEAAIDTLAIDAMVIVVNDPPVADDQSVSTNEDVPASVTLTGFDPDGDPITYSVTSGPANGSLSGTGANLTYTPNTNYNGADSFTFVTNDGNLSSPTATVSITVNPVNDAPSADDQSVTTSENTAVPVTLTGNDIDGDAVTYNVTSGPAHGSLSGSGASLTYTPDANYSGADSFTFVTNDGTVDSPPATVSITVTEVDDPPVADDQNVNTDEDIPVAITLTGSDPEGASLTYAVASGPNNGSLSGSGANLTYTPNTNFNGADSFTFVTNDGNSNSPTATVSITVNPTNDPPTADDQSVTTSENVPVSITLTGNDIDGDAITYSVTSGPTNGTLSGSGQSRTYTPDPGHTGTDTFTFVTNDGVADSFAATVTITITEVDDPPVADDQSVTTDEDVAVSVTLTGSDPDGDPITYNVTSGPANGSLSGSGANLTYTPDADYNGADSFTFVTNDGTTDSPAATVSITVNPTNDAPSADGQSVTTSENAPVSITLTGNDIDGDAITYNVTSGPANGSLSGTGANLTYTPDTNYSGSDSFTFVTNDGTVDSAAATVSITVTAVDDPPVADAQSVATDEDVAVSVTLTGSDPDGDPITYNVASGPANGSLSGSGANLTYTPDTNFNGADSFTFVTNDGNNNSPTATVSITVNPTNDAPSADDQSVTTSENDPVSITLTGNDIDGDAITYNVTSGPANGSLSGTGANLTYTPDTDYDGADSFTFVTNDGTVNSTAATVSITITPDVVNGPVFTDNFESDTGWVTNPQGTDPATTGQWERGNPQPTNSSGPKQLDITTSGSNALVTAIAAGTSVGTNDIDNGATSAWSPVISLPTGANLTLAFDYYLAHTSNSSTADYLRVSVIGDTTQVVLEELGAANDDDAAWAPASIDISAFGGQDIRLLVEAADGANGSIVEAAIDTLVINASDGGNTPPTADDQSVTTSEDVAVSITLTGADFDGDSLTYSITSNPSLGVLSGSGQTRTYTPNAGQTGTDSFTFVTNDGTDDSAPATVTITINPDGTPGIVFADDFETANGWVINPSGTDQATTGQWERANPQATNYQGAKQLNDTTSGVNALVTAAAAGSGVGSNDIDNGVTSIRSPQITLPSSGAIDLSFNFYLAHTSNSSSDDFFRVTIVGPGGSTVLLLESGDGADDDAAWLAFNTSLNAFAGQSVYFLIEAADSANGSIVEAALDDFEINVS